MPSGTGLVEGNGVATMAAVELASGTEALSASRCLEIYRIMVRSRALEERMIKMSKSGEGYFWIGGPGEEAFNVPFGLQVKKGCGPDYDFLHLHYRNSGMLLAMEAEPIDLIRQMAMTATDPFSRGRNFPGHYAKRDWNIVPVSSVVENQFVIAPGTAWVQKRRGGDAITIVVGGEAGSAEGDFASCLVWASRPDHELPLLIVVTNNAWGISTPACSQHGETHCIDRGKAFGIKGEVFDGNDPVASWWAIHRGMEYCRRERRPYMLEPLVSRLYGHSSSSGAQRVKNEVDCNDAFEKRLLETGIIDHETVVEIHDDAQAEADRALDLVSREDRPTPEDVYKDTYAPSPVDVVYPGDYTGLPQ